MKNIKNKKSLIIKIIICSIILLSVLAVIFFVYIKFFNNKDNIVSDNGIENIKEIRLKEESQNNPELDSDGDGLTNLEEFEYNTNIQNSDTDSDGITDYDEIKVYNSDPTKYSTSGDEVSDYIKIKKELDINTKYSLNKIKPNDVIVNDKIVLKPKDVNSEVYGRLEEFDFDTISLFPVFNLTNFEGTVEYETDNKDAIVVIRNGSQNYTKYRKYKNTDGKLIIKISKKENWKDFIITTKDMLNK